jgi:hypothetical protein
LQSAFKAGQDAFRLGEMDSAASQFGNAFVAAEIALRMGVQKGEPQLRRSPPLAHSRPHALMSHTRGHSSLLWDVHHLPEHTAPRLAHCWTLQRRALLTSRCEPSLTTIHRDTRKL